MLIFILVYIIGLLISLLSIRYTLIKERELEEGFLTQISTGEIFLMLGFSFIPIVNIFMGTLSILETYYSYNNVNVDKIVRKMVEKLLFIKEKKGVK